MRATRGCLAALVSLGSWEVVASAALTGDTKPAGPGVVDSGVLARSTVSHVLRLGIKISKNQFWQPIGPAPLKQFQIRIPNLKFAPG